MKKTLLRSFKQMLTIIGAQLPFQVIHQLQMVINYLKLGRWMAQHHFTISRRTRDRYGVFDAVINRIRDQQVLYLEFGVYKGTSMRYWSQELAHPEARLHGFDSFEGLPEDFDFWGVYTKGTFDIQGTIPTIEDNRVEFFKGWFDQVLPAYSIPEHDILVINMDADLYSSTIYVLRHLRPFIKAGMYIYFDNLSRPDHEPRAFEEFMAESGLKFKIVSADKSLNCAFFECIG